MSMPLIQITMWSGLSDEAKKKIVEGITKVFEDLGIPREAIEIIIYEVPKENWAIGGVRHSEKLRDVKPP
ncbi:4-oxalocrotonate tautomerase [Ignisphaera aggregans DSM 17230]|uniref:4-oxalocrotonate tautomerase n=1 Tax=Ignisphaera aggregans (strain DSM 17230 / JCM 13409 / AQ1.S1) TaxID=583356 RepID=E0SSE6_IGNAA|nr:4-oxalocrotonate tautomerase [Ignisphaera aggregans DSM 17230]